MRFILLGIFLCIASVGFAQLGGTRTYAFLDLTNSARVASLGGNVIAIQDDDLNLVYHNPSLLSAGMDNQFVLNYVNYFAGVNYGYASYAKDYGKLGTFGFGSHFIHYGEFIGANETGEITGTFKAAEYCENIYYSRKIDSLFTFGAALKTIISTLESYTSVGLAIDAGITYHNPKLFTASIMIRNAGFQLKSYTSGNSEPLPFDIQLGIAKKLEHAPIRLILTAQHLQKPILAYTDPDNPEATVDPITGEALPERKFGKIMDNVGRHMIVGAEIIPVNNFYIRMGYNYQRRQEMKIETRPFLTGMSIGVGFRIYKFHLSYGRAQYHLAGSTNHFSLSVNLSELVKKGVIPQ